MPRRRRQPPPRLQVERLPPAKRPPGSRRKRWPNLVTQEEEDRFLAAVRAGSSFADAAAYAGLAFGTVDQWLSRGRGTHSRPATPAMSRFARLTDQARAAARVMAVGNLFALGRTDVRANLEWLKRFGGPEWREVEGVEPPPGGGPSTVIEQAQVLVLDPAQLPEFVRAALAARREALPVEPDTLLISERTDGPSPLRDAGLRTD